MLLSGSALPPAGVLLPALLPPLLRVGVLLPPLLEGTAAAADVVFPPPADTPAEDAFGCCAKNSHIFWLAGHVPTFPLHPGRANCAPPVPDHVCPPSWIMQSTTSLPGLQAPKTVQVASSLVSGEGTPHDPSCA